MGVIERDKSLRLENVLSLRKKMTQQEVQQEMMKIGKFLQDNGIRKTGPVVTATFAVETDNEQPLMDMEILVPIDRKAELPEGYRLKEVFHLLHAVYARHEGNPNMLQNTYNEMLAYIQQNNLQQITAGYNVNIKEPKSAQELDDMVIDVYIGVNPSIL
ncbi:MAG: hypothetical protein PWR27_1951 [Petroclostridium sp.]|nr:transcriptional regulator, effector-binding domain/component [Clostridia bacterium]MDK2811242.1 hypothetical protein [Petroclostridium sp.]